MSVLRGILSGIGAALAPDTTMARNRWRIRLDNLVAFAVAVLAIVLAIGYQVLGRWGQRFFGEGE